MQCFFKTFKLSFEGLELRMNVEPFCQFVESILGMLKTAAGDARRLFDGIAQILLGCQRRKLLLKCLVEDLPKALLS